ncbi:MAG: DUF6503 family protein [Saprospiraceae bacterium]
MLEKVVCSILFLAIFSIQLSAQPTALAILDQSINAHDPNRHWKELQAQFNMQIERDGHPLRQFSVTLDVPQGNFEYAVKNDSLSYAQGFHEGLFYAQINEKTPDNEAITTNLGLTEDRTKYLQKVYEYLLLLPMRLERDTADLLPTYSIVDFNGSSCYQLTVAYQPEGENETWHFFIDKENHLLRGYQFFLKDISSDGEYIILDHYKEVQGVNIPFTKRWYWNKDRSFFRTDTIFSVQKLPNQD